MNNDLLKYINKFFASFEKDHTFYIDGERIKFCKATDTRVVWDMDDDWSFLTKREIKAVTIEGASLTITAMSGRKYTFIAKPKLKEEIMETIILSIKNRLILTFYSGDNKEIMRLPLCKEAIDEMMHYLDELKRINKE